MTQSTRRFPSKVDWWLGVILAALPFVGLVVAGSAIGEGNSTEMWVGVGMTGVVALMYFGLIFPMYYEITDTQLVIRSGLIRQRVELADIKEVRPTRNPLSAPALSLDRLRIDYKEGRFGYALISPANRAEFLNALAEAAGLARDGDGLKRE
jgi:hypothetical protein